MPGSLLLVTHVPIKQSAEGLFIDDQTASGIEQWCKYFGQVTYIGIEDAVSSSAGSAQWVNIATRVGTQNCKLIALPNAYRVGTMLRSYKSVRQRLKQEIREHDHLCFTIGGLVGDWPAIAGLEAIAQKRDYVAWIDRVEPEVIRSAMAGASLKRRLKNTLELPLMERYQRFLLSRSETALLQGMATFKYFSSSAPNPRCIYDTHTTPADRITPAELAGKLVRIRANAPLEIVYAGRAAAMKGTDDWLDVLTALHERGVPFRARWIGDGPELSSMQTRVENSPLKGKVVLSGFEADRQRLLGALHESDMLLFCHKTPESPRCLIEALVCGCPLVGYDSPYVSGLVANTGGAVVSVPDQVLALATEIENLHLDRGRFASLVQAAATSGLRYDEDTVYRHRAEFMMGA